MWLLLEISFTLRKGRAELYFLKYKCTPYRYITVPFTASQFLYPYCTFKSTIMYPKCPKCTYKQRYNHWAENWENLCVTLFVFSFFFFFFFKWCRQASSRCAAVRSSSAAEGIYRSRRYRQIVQSESLVTWSLTGFPPP